MAIWAFVLVLCGCEKSVQTGYGRPTGVQHATSVNGTRIFHEMIRAKGFEIDRYSKFSPRWEKYDTVFWIPDNYSPPSSELIKNIENWLAQKRGRKLVYVARDYDATMTYWEKLHQQAEGDATKDEYRRQFHDTTTEFLDRNSNRVPLSCSWFQSEQHPYTTGRRFRGWNVNLTTQKPDVRYSRLPSPGSVQFPGGKFGDYDVNVVLDVDNYPFVYTLKKQRFNPGEIVVVGNASFLLNLPLAQNGNRRLAENLIDLATANNGYDKPVLFIENQHPLPIAQRDSPDVESQWSWIAQKPLRFIVPHILFCCLLFCFVYFPIFGRPRDRKNKQTANFKDHVDAIGQLIKKSKSLKNPDAWIDEYRRRNSNNRNS